MMNMLGQTAFDMLTIGSLFSGIGGFDLGAESSGDFKTVWHSEINKYAADVFSQHWPSSVNIGDITKIDHHEIRKLQKPDIICGGFPCQDISRANSKAIGIRGQKSSLWFKMWQFIRVLRPKYIIAENSDRLNLRGLNTVLACLAKIGYNAEWTNLFAYQFGQAENGQRFCLQHRRERIYIVAYPNSRGLLCRQQKEILRNERELRNETKKLAPRWVQRRDIPKPLNFGKANGFPGGPQRIKALGNAVCPPIAEWIFENIKKHHNEFYCKPCQTMYYSTNAGSQIHERI